MKNKFWKIYGIITGIAVTACVAVLVVLWTFLASYEKSQPEHTAKDVTDMFYNLDIDRIISHYNNRSKFTDSHEVVKKAVRDHIMGSDYTYTKKMSKYTSDNPAYSIKADGKEVAVLTLKKSDKRGMYNAINWEIDDIDLGFATDGYYDIVAPADYTVTINGKVLTSDNIVEENLNASKMENVTKYADIPLLIKYRVEGAYISPEIKCTSSLSGKELTPKIEKETYTFDYETSDSIPEDSSNQVKKFITNYTKYMYTEADFSSISGSVISNSKAYEFLRYVTYTSVWYADHSSLTIGDINISNIKQYSPDCYSVETDYTYDVVMSGNNYNYPTKITLYYVRQGNGWKICDLQTK